MKTKFYALCKIETAVIYRINSTKAKLGFLHAAIVVKNRNHNQIINMVAPEKSKDINIGYNKHKIRSKKIAR